MAEEFTSIGLIGKYADPSVGATLQALRDYLQGRELDVLLDEATAQVWPDHEMTTASRPHIGDHCDLAIVVGGDGTLLNAARSLANHQIALLGINLGRLGFLTDISPDQMQNKLDAILSGEYREDKRFLLHTSIIRDGEELSESEALNDVVVHKWDVARMIEVETYVDGRFLNTVRSDGLIVSTPTGSTAYALSGGGPILQPSLDAVILVPICPHTLSHRPIVVHGESAIEIVVRGAGQSHAQVTCDGQINLGLVSGDRVRIEKKPHEARLIHPLDHDYFHILRAKLGWG